MRTCNSGTVQIGQLILATADKATGTVFPALIAFHSVQNDMTAGRTSPDVSLLLGAALNEHRDHLNLLPLSQLDLHQLVASLLKLGG